MFWGYHHWRKQPYESMHLFLDHSVGHPQGWRIRSPRGFFPQCFEAEHFIFWALTARVQIWSGEWGALHLCFEAPSLLPQLPTIPPSASRWRFDDESSDSMENLSKMPLPFHSQDRHQLLILLMEEILQPFDMENIPFFIGFHRW